MYLSTLLEYMYVFYTTVKRVGWQGRVLVIVAALATPTVCLGWLLLWRQHNPPCSSCSWKWRSESCKSKAKQQSCGQLNNGLKLTMKFKEQEEAVIENLSVWLWHENDLTYTYICLHIDSGQFLNKPFMLYTVYHLYICSIFYLLVWQYLLL